MARTLFFLFLMLSVAPILCFGQQQVVTCEQRLDAYVVHAEQATALLLRQAAEREAQIRAQYQEALKTLQAQLEAAQKTPIRVPAESK